MSADAPVRPRTVNLRRLWLQLHRWIGLSIGWVLALVGLMGAVLVVARPLDRWAHPALFQAPAVVAAEAAGPAPGVTLEALRQRLVQDFGAGSNLTFRPPREAGDTLWVIVRGDWNGTVYLDPVTGREQGRRGEAEGFVNTLFKLHSSLLLQDLGKALLAWMALVYLALLVTGLILWWPRRWPPSLRIELGKGLLRGLFDLHRTGGALLGLVIAVSVATGAYMAWRPLGEVITALGGGKPVKPPAVPKGAVPPDAVMTLDQIVAVAQARFPQDPVGYVQVPGQPNRPIRVRMRLADDPHPNGITSVWLHPRSGAVLAVHRWNELDPGARAVAVIYPLHTGELGGVALEAVTVLSGTALGLLGLTGVWLWWRRRPARGR